MKNIFAPLIITVLCGVFSCSDSSFLGETVTTDLDYEKVFSDSILTEGFLIDIYREVGFDVKGNRFGNGGLQTACDEAEFRISGSGDTDVQFASGTVNPIIISKDVWEKPYANIRRVNMFFKGLEEVSKLSEGKKKTLKAEARFLRAWYYGIMMKHYGGVPIIGDTIFTAEDDYLYLERQTFDSCLNYIVKECETAIAEGPLSAKPTGSLYGRVSANACRGLIARMKLYAASPLFNGNSDLVEGTDCPAELVGYPEFKAERWKEAKDAALEVYMTNLFKLYENHTNVHKDAQVNGQAPKEPGFGFYAIFFASHSDFNVKPDAYNELIFEDRSLGSRTKGEWYAPPSLRFEGGTKSGFSYQDLVDAFPMKNGLPITDPESGYDPANPYKDRDPRLYNTVLYDGTIMRSGNNVEEKEISTYRNADGTIATMDAVHLGTITGYYIKKGINRYVPYNSVHGDMEQTPLIRYAEILLNIAEAHNEYEIGLGKESEIVPDNEAETYQVLKQLRRRGGINNGEGEYTDPNQMFGLKKNMTRLEMRQAIRDERRIEFAYEGHRFFDVRRWRIAEDTENKMMSGMEITKQEDGTKTYKKFDVRKRIFKKSMYLWPFPYSELIKSPKMIQNPGYGN